MHYRALCASFASSIEAAKVSIRTSFAKQLDETTKTFAKMDTTTSIHVAALESGRICVVEGVMVKVMTHQH